MTVPATTGAPPRNPIDARLVFVTGKGGAGKSTVAAALGLVAARTGRRTIVAELSRRDDVRRALAGDAAGNGHATHNGHAAEPEIQIAPNLFATTIDPERAMEEYLVDQLPVRVLAQRLGSSRTFTYLAAATPGLRELLAIGKAWELAQPRRRSPTARPYDLVIVDAPATGHGVGFLGAPRTFAAVAAVGPIARHASTIHAMIADPQATAVVAVASPSDGSVTEALTVRESLAEMEIAVPRLVVNGVAPDRFAAADMQALAQLGEQLPDDAPPAMRCALRAASDSHRRAQAHRAQVTRARRRWGAGVLTLPVLQGGCTGVSELSVLADTLQARL